MDWGLVRRGVTKSCAEAHRHHHRQATVLGNTHQPSDSYEMVGGRGLRRTLVQVPAGNVPAVDRVGCDFVQAVLKSSKNRVPALSFCWNGA